MPFPAVLITQVCAETVDLDRVSITSLRYEESLDKIPTSVTIISKEDIERSNASKVIDVLKPIPGIVVHDIFGNGNQATIDISGFGEQAGLNVLVFVNGRRANNVDLSGVDWNQIPFLGLQNTIDQNGRKAVRFGNDHANNKDFYLMSGFESDFQDHGKISADLFYQRKQTDSYFLSSGLYSRKNQILTYGFTPKYTLFSSIPAKFSGSHKSMSLLIKTQVLSSSSIQT